MYFIPDSFTKEEVSPESVFCCGETFGNFEKILLDLDEPLGEVIPNFHNMEFRLHQLHDAVVADKMGRVASVRDILSEIEPNADEMCLAESSIVIRFCPSVSVIVIRKSTTCYLILMEKYYVL